MVAASKVPMLKHGEYEIERMRIEQYIQMIDYALWEAIENDATLPKTKVVEGVTTEMPITTAKEKAQTRLEDAKKLLEAVEKRFGRNAATKKTKTDLNIMSMDDLYNNLKVYEPEVKGMSSSCSSTQNIAFVSSSNNNTSNTIGAVNAAYGVSTASTQVNAAYSTNIDNLSDVSICSLFASQPNSPQLVHEDLEQIHLEDMEEMDLRWQTAMLTMRARSLDEFVNKHVVENCKAKSSEEEPKVVRTYDDALIIEEWVSDDEEEDVSQPKIEKKIVKPSIAKIEFVKSKQQ
uniref:Uncharacterized protein n=1 Tax=Tanacetum cinerariifolium TaxID=118510 RepID=A0A6L2N0P6_TANCI|nr:hypothetical protein [Tanacetum cinerariifolium]